MTKSLKSVLYSFLWCAILCIHVQYIYGQIQVSPSNLPPYNPENLIQNIFLGEGVEIIDVQFSGVAQAAGVFTNGLNDIGLDRGIVISTGNVVDIANDNNDVGTSSFTSGESLDDEDLSDLVAATFYDIVRYEITFKPVSDILRFRYVFASEEYPEWVCTPFNDVFGFFISGPNPGGGQYSSENIALVPDPNDPSGSSFTNLPVAINTVNPGVPGSEAFEEEDCQNPSESLNFSEYYNDNTISNSLMFDGFLDVFTAQASVVPCEEYTIKIVIADVEDADFDSGVFLEAKSFSSTALTVNRITDSPNGVIAESCGAAVLEFSFPHILESDTVIQYRILQDPNQVNATLNVDYTLSSTEVMINEGENSAELIITALDDQVEEGEEIILVEVQRDLCLIDTISVIVTDNKFANLILPDDVTICEGSDYLIDVEVPGELELNEPLVFSNNTDIFIDFDNIEYISDIQVSGVVPEYLGPNVIMQVCIDTLVHAWLGDLDIYLISPDGYVLELSTNNGGDGGNGITHDTLLHTCFVLDSAPNINNGDPVSGDLFPDNLTYSGAFLPEGEWEDLWTGESSTNGIWSLLIIDDEEGAAGVLNSWSITFNSSYNIEYSWSPGTGNIDCMNCQDVVVSPTVSTTYILTGTDTYGCVIKDSIHVSPVGNAIVPEGGACNISENNNIIYTWHPVGEGTEYEVKLTNEQNWMNIGNDTFFLLQDLEPDTIYTLDVRVVSENCESPSINLTCSTPSCVSFSIFVESLEDARSCVDDGAVDFSATGPTPLEFNLNGEVNDSGMFDGLAGGEYTVLVVDASGCSDSLDFTISQDGFLEIETTVVQELSCFDTSDGSLSVQVNGSHPPYQYEWSNGEQDSEIFNLTEGTYEVTVTDRQMCSATANVVLSPPEQLLIDRINVQSPDCVAGNIGSAEAIVAGGVGPYNYYWNDPLNQRNSFAVNLEPGDYMVTVIDANFCSDVESLTVEAPLIIEGEKLQQDINCAGAQTGIASFSITQGTPPYQFNWSNGSQDSMLTDLVEGAYQLTITDSGGCSREESFVISSPDSLRINPTVVQISCTGIEDANISLFPEGGTGAYRYEWGNGEITESLTDLGAGTYCVTVIDDNDCTTSACFDIESPEDFIVAENISNISCAGGAEGSIELEISGAVSPYEIEWQGPGFSSSDEDIFNLNSGNYSLTITDANQCMYISSFQVAGISPIILLLSSKADVSCRDGTDGSLEVAVSGGTAPYQINWTGPDNFQSQGGSIVGLISGEYNVEVYDNNNCMLTESIFIDQPISYLEILQIENDTICPGSTDGHLIPDVSGGVGPYNYSWSNGTSEAELINAVPGSYFLTVTDNNDCSTTSSSIVIELENINIDISQRAADCSGSSTGIATIENVSYGMTSAPITEFEFQWNSSPPQMGPVASGLLGGITYTVLATDPFGCTTTEHITIESPDPLEVSVLEKNDVSCFGGSDGNISVTGTGGNSPYTYNWSSNVNQSLDNEAFNLVLGNYFVTITDVNGCTNSAEFSVSEATRLGIELSSFDVSCKGGSDGQVFSVATGGTGSYQYQWANGATSSTVGSLNAGTYQITVTDGNQCEIISEVVVSEPENDLTFSVDTQNSSCQGEPNGSIKVFAEGGNGNYLYSADGKIFRGSSEIIGLLSGVYTVYVKDGKGCSQSLEQVELNDSEAFSVQINQDTSVFSGDNVYTQSVLTNGEQPVDYFWEADPSIDLTCYSCETTGVISLADDVYLTLEVIDANGCFASDSRLIEVDGSAFVIVPTGFTPDNNGVNDLLNVFGRNGITVERFRVYSRWGQVVFDTGNFEVNDLTVGWDGSFKGSELNPDTYIWTVDAILPDGTTERFQGNTMLIR